jgi:hypothetical protein
MNARQAVLAVVGLAVAVALTSVAAAGAGAANQRMAITSNLYPKRESCSSGCGRESSSATRVLPASSSAPGIR